MNLAFREFRIDNQPAILHRHELVHLDDAGFDIDRDIGHLDSAYALGHQSAGIARVVLAHFRDLVTPNLRQASYQGRLLDELSFTWMRPSIAASWSGEVPRTGATTSNNLFRALVVDFSVEGETP